MIKLGIAILLGRDLKNLERLLKSLKKDIKYINELIFVKDVNYNISTIDEIKTIVKTVFTYDINFKLYEYIGTIKQPEMRNLGIRNSDCDYIWFLDDDTTVLNSSLKTTYLFLNKLSQTAFKNVVIAGRISEGKINKNKDKRPIRIGLFRGFVGNYDWKYSIEYKKYDSIKINLMDYPIIPFPQGTNMIFNKNLLIKEGGFRNELCDGYAVFEDSEPSLRLKKKGILTIYNDQIEVYHHVFERVGNFTRSIDDIKYCESIVKNYTITMVFNEFPTKFLSHIYINCFIIALPFRIILFRFRNDLKLKLHQLSYLYFKFIKIYIKISKNKNKKRTIL